jgi:hypothetical protein
MIVDIPQIVRAELDRVYEPKLAACWEMHKPLLLAQMAMLEGAILTVLERVNDADNGN